MALGRWQLPLLRRRLLRPRWVASYGVGFEFHPARNGMAAAFTLAHTLYARARAEAAQTAALWDRCSCAGVFVLSFRFVFSFCLFAGGS